MIKLIFYLIVIIGIFLINPAYSEKLILICAEKEKKIEGQTQSASETNTMFIDLINKTLQFPSSDKTQKIQIIETSEIRWYSHYQNEKNLAFVTWDVLN